VESIIEESEQLDFSRSKSVVINIDVKINSEKIIKKSSNLLKVLSKSS